MSNKSEDSKSNDAGNEEEIKVSKEFQENVVKYVKYDDLIRKKQKEVQELKTKRKPCEDFILKYLEDIDETTIELNNGKLRKNKFETKVPINKDIIKDAIAEKIKDEKTVEDILEHIDTARPKIKQIRSGVMKVTSPSINLSFNTS